MSPVVRQLISWQKHSSHFASGDHVWFSSHIGQDDSNFFAWGDEDYILIPCDAIQAVEVP